MATQTLDNEAIFEQSQSQLVDMLENSLLRQVELNKSYSFDQAMAVAEQVNAIADYIGKNKVLEKPEFKAQGKRIEKLFKEVDMSITLARSEVADRLAQIRQAKMTLGAYGENT